MITMTLMFQADRQYWTVPFSDATEIGLPEVTTIASTTVLDYIFHTRAAAAGKATLLIVEGTVCLEHQVLAYS